MEDEFEELRKKSVRTSAVYEELEEEESSSSGFGQILGSFSPAQRLVLALLLLLNICAVGFAFLLIAGVVNF